MSIDALLNDIIHNKVVLEQYNRRKKVLELQSAQFGLYTPAYIQIEMNDLYSDILFRKSIISKLYKQITLDFFEHFISQVIYAYSELLSDHSKDVVMNDAESTLEKLDLFIKESDIDYISPELLSFIHYCQDVIGKLDAQFSRIVDIDENDEQGCIKLVYELTEIAQDAKSKIRGRFFSLKFHL